MFCEVDSDPQNVTFQWFLNNSSKTIEIKSFTTNGTNSVASYSPKSRFDYGTLLCWATNTLGRQNKPCIFYVIPAGK